MRETSFIFFAFVVFTFLVSSSKPSLLPFLDPFGVLEQAPFDLHKEHKDVVPAARVDWKETEERHVMRVDVPGMRKEEVKIEVDEENRILRVMGERKREEQEKGEHWHRLERSYGKFLRQFRLPNDVDLESVGAKLQNGVLTLTLPKLSPHNIKVKGPRVVSILDGEPPAAELNSGEHKHEL